MTKEVYLDQQAIRLVGDPSGMLFWPEEWTDELQSHKFIDVATQILLALPPSATKTPWLISSASKSLLGAARSESESHMSGRAFDMAPMYDADNLLAPDGHIMGLAWNVISLMIISWAYKTCPCFVVEGDHLHVQPDAVLDPAVMFTAFTMPTWYSWTTELMSSEELDVIPNSIWTFDMDQAILRCATRDEMYNLRNALS